MTWYLSHFRLLTLRRALEREAHEQFPVFNQDGLLSALAAPKQAMFGRELHPTLDDKAAALLFSLIQNHPFADGNKRIAVRALRHFLVENAHTLRDTDDEVMVVARAVARGEWAQAAIQSWIAERI